MMQEGERRNESKKNEEEDELKQVQFCSLRFFQVCFQSHLNLMWSCSSFKDTPAFNGAALTPV